MIDGASEMNEIDRLRVDLGITGQEPEQDCDPMVRLRYLAATQVIDTPPKSIDIGDKNE